jgi:hypothetical protein
MIHGMFQKGGEITENAATINRNDVWLRARNQREMRTPRMAIDAAGAEIWEIVWRLVSWDVMPKGKRTGQTVLVAAMRQFPGYQERENKP